MEVVGLEKTHADDLTSNMHNPVKSTRVNDRKNFFLQNFVFKMGNESEHSDSEFYYPGEFHLQRGYLNLKYVSSKRSISVVDFNNKIP